MIKPIASFRWKRASILAVLGAAILAVCGCESISYYRQAIAGQYQIFSRQRPIQKLMLSPQTPEALKARFSLVMELREYARTKLRLPVDGHYLKYADLERKHVVWNVYAAPELSLEQKTWWYPVVGRLKYRGYFSEGAARTYAAKLERQCLDVYVAGVDAYSTLGWFKESLLNTFIYDDEADLAETLFHELAHQRVFISGDTDFNEAFATLVGQEGARRWFLEKGNTNALKKYEALLEREDQFVHLIARARDNLKTIYDSPMPLDAKRTAKTRALEDLQGEHRLLKESWEGNTTYDRWFSTNVNNAKLNTVATYNDLVPGFGRLLDSCKGDLNVFYREVEKLKKVNAQERRKRLAG